MQPETTVELADRVSRKRAIGVAAAGLAYLIVQVVARPFFVGGADIDRRVRIDFWGINAIALLLLLATGGGLINSRKVRALVNDEVSRDHYKSAIIAAHWVAMTIAMALYFIPRFSTITAREAIYAVVTPSIIVATLVFSYLELRAHRDA